MKFRIGQRVGENNSMWNYGTIKDIKKEKGRYVYYVRIFFDGGVCAEYSIGEYFENEIIDYPIK